MRHVLNAVIAALVLAYVAVPSTASAQCAFEHPKKAKKFQTSLVQAFHGCSLGFNSCCSPANTTTEGGVPACKPPETFKQLNGDQPGSWTWDELKGAGQIALKAAPDTPTNPLNPPANSADIRVQVKLQGVLDDTSSPASGSGGFTLLLRTTINDRQSGDMTLVDIPINIGFLVAGGKANVKTSIDSYLNNLPQPQPGLPKCSSAEIVFVDVRDPHGAEFGSAGIFLP